MGQRERVPVEELKPLVGPIKKRSFLTFDIESKDGDSQRPGFTRPFMVGLYDEVDYQALFDQYPGGDWERRWYFPGGCVDRAMRTVLQPKYAGWHIYAHNAGRFDYLFATTWLMNIGEKLGYYGRIIPVSSSIQVLDIWRYSKGKRLLWRFLDSLKLIPMGLDKAAKTFGLEGKLKCDLSMHETDPRWVPYNREDCVQLHGVLEKFHAYVEDVLLGEVGITAPSTAMKLYRRRYLPGPLPRSRDTHEFVRAGYFGGRTEVFQKEGKHLRYYDINSSYPRAMLEPMPAGEAVWWEGEPPQSLQNECLGFVEADVHVPEMFLPPLPVRQDAAPAKGKLIFPVGNLSGIWEWDELKLALEEGCTIERWKRSVWYQPVEMFADYVRDLYRYRDKSHPDYDAGLATVVKLLLNATYGKFGMRTLRKKIYRWDDPSMPDNAFPASGDPESVVWYAEEECDAGYIMPQVSARVTALARVRLYRYMREALRRGGGLWYCDTDSIVTDVVLPTSSELGELKDEFPEASGQLEGRFIGPKLYLMRGPGVDLVKAKGLERRTREMVELLESGATILQRRLEKIGSLAQADFQRGPRMIVVPRTHRAGDAKRENLPRGGTRPYRLKMW